jgi:hypothetical protein
LGRLVRLFNTLLSHFQPVIKQLNFLESKFKFFWKKRWQFRNKPKFRCFNIPMNKSMNGAWIFFTWHLHGFCLVPLFRNRLLQPPSTNKQTKNHNIVAWIAFPCYSYSYYQHLIRNDVCRNVSCSISYCLISLSIILLSSFNYTHTYSFHVHRNEWSN